MDRESAVNVFAAEVAALAGPIANPIIALENARILEEEVFTLYRNSYYAALYKVLRSTRYMGAYFDNCDKLAITLATARLTVDRIKIIVDNAMSDIAEYRKKQKAIFAKYLIKADPYFTNINKLNAIVDDIENSCVDFAKIHSHNNTSHLADICENVEFKATYSPICNEILSYINIESETCATYGTEVIKKLIDGQIDPKKIAFMKTLQLCPQSTKVERKKIEERMNQKIELKVSTLFQCPSCKESRCNYKETHKRSLDEAASYDCICLNPTCGRIFSVSGN